MAQVVCLIADPERAPLEQVTVSELRRAVGGQERRLAEAEACYIAVEDGGHAQVLARLAAAVPPSPPCDLAVLPAGHRRKRLPVSDLDSTMITVESNEELADYLGPEVSAITRRAMNGEVDFVAALRARVALLEGLPVEVFDEVFRERVRLMPDARTLVGTMRAWGARAALVSGGFVPFAERVRDRQLTRVLRLPPAATLAIGDGANDLPMLQVAGRGVAFRPSPAVARAAPVTVRRGDLNAVLYLQRGATSHFVRG